MKLMSAIRKFPVLTIFIALLYSNGTLWVYLYESFYKPPTDISDTIYTYGIPTSIGICWYCIIFILYFLVFQPSIPTTFGEAIIIFVHLTLTAFTIQSLVTLIIFLKTEQK